MVGNPVHAQKMTFSHKMNFQLHFQSWNADISKLLLNTWSVCLGKLQLPIIEEFVIKNTLDEMQDTS